MKKIYFLVFILILPLTVKSQTAIETQEFIIEQIKANNALPNYKNGAFFHNILRSGAERIANKVLDEIEFENLFVCGRDVYKDDEYIIWGWTVLEVIDLRDVYKVVTTRHYNGEQAYYSISLILRGNFYSTVYLNNKVSEPKWEEIDKMRILISDNKEAANKIKKALIHLGRIKGIQIKDGDLF